MKYQPREDCDIQDVVYSALHSPNESDRNGETANVVDGLFFIGRAINRVADALLEIREDARNPFNQDRDERFRNRVITALESIGPLRVRDERRD